MNKYLATAVVIASGAIVKKALDKSYEKISDKPAPKNPEDPSYSVGEVFAYALLASTLSALTTTAIRAVIHKND